MNTDILKTLIDLERLPDNSREDWLGDAEQGVQFLAQKRGNETHAILYANGPHLYTRSILVPCASVESPDQNMLLKACLSYIDPYDSWSIEHSYSLGGDEEHWVSLAPPLSRSECQTLGGEHVVFLRHFDGIKEYDTTIEVCQKLVHSLGLYYMDERQAYCRLNKHGDIESVIKVHDDKGLASRQRVRAVTIRWHDLATYMALSSTALVTKFDFNRYVPGAFPTSKMRREKVQIFQAKDVYYRYRVIPNNASYAVGHIILQTSRTKDDLAEEWKAEKDTSKRRFASFKILDRKNDGLVETSCGPEHIVNYFTDSDLPWELSPAFFNPEVLVKYKSDPEKYTINDREISCRGAWSLRSYYINEVGQVHAWMCDLADLPYEEQLYWKSFNEWPRGDISKRALENDILGEVSSEDDPLDDLRGQVQSLNRHQPSWWQARGVALVERVLHPATDSWAEWGEAIMALDQMIVEGFSERELRSQSTSKRRGSLNLLEDVLSITGRTEEQAKALVEPLKELHSLRNSVKAHGNIRDREAAVADARKKYGILRQHFKDLTERIRNSMKEIVLSLPEAPSP